MPLTLRHPHYPRCAGEYAVYMMFKTCLSTRQTLICGRFPGLEHRRDAAQNLDAPRLPPYTSAAPRMHLV
jgi:hypothetical protein